MFARPEDLLKLSGLGGRPFEEFVLDLVRAEARRHGIPPANVHWDHRTTLPDGGRDIVVDAQHSDPNPPFVPQRPSIWSAKSGKDGVHPATLRHELVEDHHEALRDHLKEGNPYVWCTLQPMDEDGQKALRDKVKQVSEKEFTFDPKLVEFRSLTDLCTILNDHPGLIPKHLPDLADKMEGVLTLQEWKRGDRFAVEWVDFAKRGEILSQIRDHLRGRAEPNVLHLAGLS